MNSNDREKDDDDDSESSSDSDDYQDIPDALSSLNKEKGDTPENSDEESDLNSDEESDRPDDDHQSDMDGNDDDDDDDDDDNGKKKKKKGNMEEQMEEEDVDDVIEEGRLFIRNLPYSCTEEEIKAFMKQHGEITDVFIPLNAKRESKGFAFVTFMFPEQAILAMEVGLLDRSMNEWRASEFMDRN